MDRGRDIILGQRRVDGVPGNWSGSVIDGTTSSAATGKESEAEESSLMACK